MSLSFDEFAAVRKRKKGADAAATDDARPEPTPAENRPQPSVSRFVGSRGFQFAVIVGIMLECALMPLSLARVAHWLRTAADVGVYAVAAGSVVELVLVAATAERFRLAVVLDTLLQLGVALSLLLQVGFTYPAVAWVPFLRTLRIFECVSVVEGIWRRQLDAAEDDVRAAKREVRELRRLLDDAAAQAQREDETNQRLHEALEKKAEEAAMLQEALVIAAEQQAAAEGERASTDTSSSSSSSSSSGRRVGGKEAKKQRLHQRLKGQATKARASDAGAANPPVDEDETDDEEDDGDGQDGGEAAVEGVRQGPRRFVVQTTE